MPIVLILTFDRLTQEDLKLETSLNSQETQQREKGEGLGISIKIEVFPPLVFVVVYLST